MAIDFKGINAALDPETCVKKWLPDGYREGHNWVARNPVRADGRPGSFKVEMRTGVWKDWADDTAKGGDLVSLYAYLFHGRDQGAAARELIENFGLRDGVTPAKIHRIEDERPKILMPVPDGAPPITFDHPRHGEPTTIYPYYDGAGRLMMCVCRFERVGENGKRSKEFSPRCFTVAKDGKHAWRWQGPVGDARRPLYGLDRLAARPDVDVIVVEGEKAADAGEAIFGDEAVFVSWCGGTDVVGYVDWRPLRGRRVYFWPDADAQRLRDAEGNLTDQLKPLRDQPGMKAALTAVRALAEIAPGPRLIGYDMQAHADAGTGGWDIADAMAEGWDMARCLAYIAEHAGDPFRVAGEVRVMEDELRVMEVDEPDAPKSGSSPKTTPLDQDLNPFAFPRLSEKGKPINAIENVAHLLDQYGISIRYNLITKRSDVVVPGRKYTIDNHANSTLAEITSLAARNNVPRSELAMYLDVIADMRWTNPVREWIDSVPWDGVSRLAALSATLATEPKFQTLRDALLRRWLISAIAAVYGDRGVRAAGVLVMQGVQGAGKTRWLERMCDPRLGATLDGTIVDPANKDTVLLAVGHWIVELGELDATFKRADIARLKAFVTQSVDKIRSPYARRISEYPRRTVFCASVNARNYLVDETGNRRWWTVPVLSVDTEHDIDMQQLWAEVVELYVGGEQWWLTASEEAMLAELNRDHQLIDPLEEAVLGRWNWSRKGMGRQMTATDVLFRLGYLQPTKAQATAMSQILIRLTGANPQRVDGAAMFRMPSERLEVEREDRQERIVDIPG